MNKKILIILGVIVAIAAVGAAAMMFSASLPNDDADKSKIDILGNGTIEENGTLNVKLSNSEGIALKDKDIHLSIKDSNGSVVFEKSAKTFVNGVANIKIENVSAGEYEVNATFNGDKNHSSCSVSEKLVINGTDDNSTDDSSTSSDDTSDDTSSTGDSAQSSSQSSSSSSRYSPSYNYNGGGQYYDGGSSSDSSSSDSGSDSGSDSQPGGDDTPQTDTQN